MEKMINYPETEKDFIGALNDYNEAYREGLGQTQNGKPLVSDETYDAMTEDFRLKFPNSSWFEKIEEEAQVDGADDVYHSKPMLSTEKAYTIEEVKKWINRIKKSAKEIDKDFSKIKFIITPKLDGLAGKDENSTFATRGNGMRGSRIDYAFDRGLVPIGGRNQGLGEIIIKQSYYEKNLQSEFPHPRNVVVGIIKADTLREHSTKALEDKAVHFVPYQTLESWEGDSNEMLKSIDSICKNIKEKTDYLLDGFVIEIKDEELKEYMGATGHHNRWQIALKEKGDLAQPKISGITIQIGRTGVATPVLEIEPTFLSGAIIRRVTAHNMGFIKKNSIGIGSKIEIVRSGEVIPKVERVIEPSEKPHEIQNCPSCDSSLYWDNEEIFMYCSNKKDCPEQVLGRIFHFFSTIDNCDGFGKKTIETLVSIGVDSIEKIYRMSAIDFENLGFGSGISVNLEKALNDSKINIVEDWRLLAAFGIKNLGRGDSKKILKHFNINDINNLKSKDIIKIEGFGKKTSDSVEVELLEKWDTIKFILDSGFNIEHSKNPNSVDTILTGKNILLTGTMTTLKEDGKPYKRPEMEKIVEQMGANVQKQVNSKTNILVYGEKAGSKLSKAEKIGTVWILTEEEFWEAIK
jgi:DNA ligase (NAD+)